MRIQVVAALLTTSVSRAILQEFVEYAEEQDDECVFPPERWAATFRSLAQLILQEIAAGYGYPRPNLGEILYQEAKQPAPSRLILLEEVNAELCGDFSPQPNTNGNPTNRSDLSARLGSLSENQTE